MNVVSAKAPRPRAAGFAIAGTGTTALSSAIAHSLPCRIGCSAPDEGARRVIAPTVRYSTIAMTRFGARRLALCAPISDTGAGSPAPGRCRSRMKPRSLRSISLAALAGILLSLLPTAAHADALSDLEAQIQHYQDELAQINTQSITVGDQIAATQGRIALLEGVLADLNSQLLTNTAHLSDQQHQLDTLVTREDVLTGQLNQTQVRLDERQAAFAAEVRVLDKVEYRNPLGLL